MADQLLETLENRFEPEAYSDQYREQVLAMIQAKAKGKQIQLPPRAEPRPQVVSLAEILKQSVQQARRERKAG